MPATPMNKISPSEMPKEIGVIRDTLNQLTGDASFVEVFAQAPELLDFVMKKFYGEIFFAGRVAEKYKQLARLRLSLSHGCRTCNLQNIPGSQAAGISAEKTTALQENDYSVFGPDELAVLKYADQMLLTNHEGRLDKKLYDELSEHFDNAQICELGVVMAVIGGMAKLSFVMDLVEREDYCPFG